MVTVFRIEMFTMIDRETYPGPVTSKPEGGMFVEGGKLVGTEGTLIGARTDGMLVDTSSVAIAGSLSGASGIGFSGPIFGALDEVGVERLAETFPISFA